MTPQEFVEHWSPSGGGEKANYVLFLSQLCRLIDVAEPQPKREDDAENRYVPEKTVTIHNGDGTTSKGFIDLYKAKSFVLETKQGVERREADEERPKARTKGHGVRGTPAMDAVLQRARTQAERYAKALPDEWPPFLVVIDIGATFDLYAVFSGTGKNYAPFPNPRESRFRLVDLEREEIRERLRAVWDDPLSLDPARVTAEITREIAGKLGRLAKKLEKKHPPQAVAEYLLRCIFTMFAEDVGLLRAESFTEFLKDRRKKPELLHLHLQELWRTMNAGGLSPALDEVLLRFNGGLFRDASALPVDVEALELLIDAAEKRWKDVEPAIFGTLLENALDDDERHYLGAHYTPRRYVERLVLPTLVEPIREDWAAAQAAAYQLDLDSDRSGAIRTLRDFHRALCNVAVLDPACGTGNFLYVAYDHLKRLETEVLAVLATYDAAQANLEFQGATVTPRQFHGLEKNERAPAIAQLVLWIGHIQWHYRTHGVERPPEPVLEDYETIQMTDAVLAWDRVETVLDDAERPLREWDGKTMRDPVTLREAPDLTHTRGVEHYVNPRPAPAWPRADFIVGNPPYIGNWKMRGDLGGGYVEALRRVYPEVPDSVDFVMYWWERSAALVRAGEVRAFGLITTNSLRQVHSRAVLSRHLAAEPPLRLAVAIPDHPWTKDVNGADVRVAMTVGTRGHTSGTLKVSVREARNADADGMDVEFSEIVGRINPDLTVGVDVTNARKLRANRSLCSPGVKLHGDGFIVTPARAVELGLGTVAGVEGVIVPYRNGNDINKKGRNVMVIDLFGLTEDEVRGRFPSVYQHIYETVRPHRMVNNEPYRRINWWLFGRKNTILRAFSTGLSRYIVTTETSKHRFFTFLDGSIRPDNKLICIGSSDAFVLGVLSSKTHRLWAHQNRALLEDRPVYVKTTCFDPFPFPDADEPQRVRIRALGEALDAHRKARQVAFPGLKLTDVYNVLAKVRAGEALSPAERRVHEEALVTVLRSLHDDLDRAVAEAYDWPEDLDDEETLRRLLELNRERAREERDGRVRWLRPDFQNPEATGQAALVRVDEAAAEEAPAERVPWPAALPDRARAVAAALARLGAPATVEEVARTFRNARRDAVAALLETLAELGQARRVGDAYAA